MVRNPIISVIIPSRNEKFLNQTIQSVLDNATGEIEVFAVLDGYDTERIDGVHYILLENTEKGDMQKRQGVNKAVSMAKGEYIMSLDAHCMMGKGFDEILVREHKPNWVQVPRRYKLDAENWCVKYDQPPVDYEYWMWRYLTAGKGSHGFKELHDYRWDERQKQREHILIDDKMTMQASCWFMTKDWFLKNGFMRVEGYTGWGQEAEEICLTTWSKGGRVVVNKKTWYAHLYKGKKHGRMYFMSKKQRNESIQYSYNYWVNEHREDFVKVINKFMPVPNFCEDWESKL